MDTSGGYPFDRGVAGQRGANGSPAAAASNRRLPGLDNCPPGVDVRQAAQQPVEDAPEVETSSVLRSHDLAAYINPPNRRLGRHEPESCVTRMTRAGPPDLLSRSSTGLMVTSATSWLRARAQWCAPSLVHRQAHDVAGLTSSPVLDLLKRFEAPASRSFSSARSHVAANADRVRDVRG